MNILIVEDRKDKRHEIKRVIQEKNNDNIEIAKTYFSAKNKIFSNRKYDMIIMDMFLPDAKDDAELRGLAGKDLIFDMLAADIEIPVLVVTQYAEYTNAPIIFERKNAETLRVIENPLYGKGLPDNNIKGSYDCTHFEGLHQYLSDEVPMYLGIIYYSNQFSEWEANLLYFIEKVRVDL